MADAIAFLNLVILVGLAVYQVIKNRELATLTSRLQYQVNKLSIAIDQSISRLNRARDLVNNLQLAHQEYYAKMAANVFLPGDYVEMAKVMRGSLTELAALANVIGDKELGDLVDGFEAKSTDLSNKIALAAGQKALSPDWFKEMNEFEQETIKMHTKVYALLADAVNK